MNRFKKNIAPALSVGQQFGKFAAWILIAVFFSSCDGLERTVELDLRQSDPRFVVEGLITNETTWHTIKVSKTTSFYHQGGPAVVSGAVVQVKDQLGNAYLFEELGQTPGTYQAYFTGVVGHTYSLEISVESRVIRAEETMLPVTPIDSITWVVNEDRKNDPDEDDPDAYYEVLLYAKEPQDREDFYLFKFYRNGEIQNFDYSEVYVADDILLNGNIDGLSTGIFYAEHDTVDVSVYSLTRKAFVFYNDLLQSLTNDGGIFGPIPANLRSNLSDGTLGYFRVSAVDKANIVIGVPR
jgi:hypothetical protein